MAKQQRQTTHPVESPQQLTGQGWLSIALRMYRRIDEHNLSLLSAGIAFYAMLAIFPALAAVVTLYALVSDPADIQNHFNQIAGVLPAEVSRIVSEQLESLAARPQQALGTNLVIGLAFAIWSAHRGVHALVQAITLVYREPESRNVFVLNGYTFLLTVGAVVTAVITMLLMLGVPAVLSIVPMDAWLDTLSRVAVWGLLFVVIVVSLGGLYRLSPPRRPAQWRWLSTGALVATVLWLLGSFGFSFYVGLFGTFDKTYGALGAIIVLLLWFFLTNFSIILGALLNAEMEYQTTYDTTIGAERPIGQRGAVVADQLPDN